METELKKEIKKTSKKATSSFAFWAIGAALICCGGPIVLFALIGGGAAGILGFLFSNLFLISAGVMIFLLTIFWLIMKMRG